MRCPLCGGPVHETDGGFECQVGHKVDGAELVRVTDEKLAEAMWMAIQALDNEADVLRAAGGEAAKSFADDAEGQAHLLRDFARRQNARFE